MGAYYANGYTGALTSSYQTGLAIHAGTGVRPRVFQIGFSSTTSADKALEWLIQRLSADGTGTSVTPKPFDPADPAGEVTAKRTYSGEPTYTSGETPIDLGGHQKSQVIWNAYDEQAKIIIPATSGAGLGMQFKSGDSATPVVKAHMSWQE